MLNNRDNKKGCYHTITYLTVPRMYHISFPFLVDVGDGVQSPVHANKCYTVRDNYTPHPLILRTSTANYKLKFTKYEV